MTNLTFEKTLLNGIYCLPFKFLIMPYIGNMTLTFLIFPGNINVTVRKY